MRFRMGRAGRSGGTTLRSTEPATRREERVYAMSASIVERFRVIDTDTHLVEPPDLWTSRMSGRWGDLVPSVRWDAANSEEAWFIGDQRIAPVASAAQAGWGEFPPDHPRRWSDADPGTWDAKARLARMDEYGIYAQVLYPN